MKRYAAVLLAGLLALVVCFAAAIADEAPPPSIGDRMLADYFRNETAAIAEQSLAPIHTLEDWTSRREEYRRQLAEMLSLDPMPQRTDLKPAITGRVEHDLFTVENLHFQSRPGLYVTGNLYLPKGLDKPAPAVLYVCGHAPVKKDGVSYGNKTHYQFHPAWFARNGFVCLTIDTVQLGEIEGLHHGTYREGMWWWNSRGYTPAGVEAWNGIRALDYLETRPEVDRDRLGVTGRSGGGAYSWWIAALDDRVKAAVPVAGITDLEDHVVDGCVEGHCDCMYLVNTYRWDYAQVAALVAPRPLLIANSDKDPIFPLDGVQRIHAQVRRIYQLYGADDKLGLAICEGPHKDTQELQVAAFHWFNRFLKGEDPLVEGTGASVFEPQQLQVFCQGLPLDQITSRVHEEFVPQAADPCLPDDSGSWQRQREVWLSALTNKCFGGWPGDPGALDAAQAFRLESDGFVAEAIDYTSQHDVRLRLYAIHRSGGAPGRLAICLGPGKTWGLWLAALKAAYPEPFADEPAPDCASPCESLTSLAGQLDERQAIVLVAPRGVGRTRWDQGDSKQIQNRRRFMLLGQTLAGMQVWDVRRAVQALRSLAPYGQAEIELSGQGDMAAVALYASLFEPEIARLDLLRLPASHRQGPDLLNVLRYLDLPQAVAMACERSQVTLTQDDAGGWEFPRGLAERLGWDSRQFQVALAPKDESADIQVTEDDEQITIETPQLSAVVRKKGYVSGVAGGTFVDKRTGFRDLGHGLDIVDWIMEPGSDEAYRDELPEEMVYQYGNLVHGSTPKRSIEGPQICTQAKEVDTEVIRGRGFVAVKLEFRYRTAAPGHKTGSLWTQTLLFPEGKRYFISSDRIDSVNSSPAMFLRVDMPGHIKHEGGDNFSEIYLSYVGRIPSSEFNDDFPPDAKFNYRRDDVDQPPGRFIRAYRCRNPENGQDGPWLAGMTLDPADVYEAWCHQRGYVSLIEEFGGRPIEAGQSFSAAFIVGFFDSVDEMHQVYDQHAGHSGLQVTPDEWRLTE